MANRQVDFPDEFYERMINTKQETGKTVRRQVLEALCEKWGWGIDKLPRDGRINFGYQTVAKEAAVPSWPAADDGWGTPAGEVGAKEEF